MAEITDAGFEYEGEFVRWHVSDMGKDLMLIDRFSGMAITEFFDLLDDDASNMRAPVLLSLIATSLRHARPDWSIDRIARVVMAMQLSSINFVSGDSDEDDGPLADQQTDPEPSSRDEPSLSTANGSSLSSIPPESALSPTSSETPA